MIFFAEFPAPYQIIDTDYTSYAIVYSCEMTCAQSILINENVYLLSRTALVEGTADHTTFVSNMKAIMDTKIPSFDYDTKLRYTLHGETENNC